MDKIVSIKVIKYDNTEFMIDNTVWRIPSNGLDGFANITNEIGSQKRIYSDGATLGSIRTSEVDRTVSCSVINQNNNEELRQKAIKFFNSKKKYKLVINYMGLQRWCEGYLSKVQISQGNIYQPVSLQFTITCLDPYFRSMDNFGQDIASVMSLVGFPYHSRAEWGGHPVGYYNFSRSVKIYNDGDVPTNVRVVINALGDVVNPKFAINDKYVRILDELSENDMVEIDFTSQPPTVKKNGSNIIGKCDRTSNFSDMQIQLGENMVSYNADTGDTFLTCSVYYNKNYLMI